MRENTEMRGFVDHEKEIPWQIFTGEEAHLGNLQWKMFGGAEDQNTSGVTYGICDIPPDGGLYPHTHAQPEFYYVLSGSGRFLIGATETDVEQGSTAFVPGGVVHAIRSTGQDMLRLLWIIPADRWGDVNYTPSEVGETISHWPTHF